MKAKKRVLVFIDWFLPGYKAGGPIQSCANLIEHLKYEFDFWVITRNTDYCETKPYANVTSDTWNRLDDHLQIYYISGANLGYTSLARAAQEARPDFIFINGIYSLYFSILPLFVARTVGCQQVFVSARGMLAPSAIQVKGLKKKLFLQMAKTTGLYKRVCFHATNKIEANHIKTWLGAGQSVRIAPNLARPVAAAPAHVFTKSVNELRLISVARISPEKNTKYALDVLKDFSYPGRIIFDVYGPVYDEVYWAECQKVIADIAPNIEVKYKGSLERELVHDTLQQYHALFLPTRGENFGHIILESMLAGLPVVISDQTPWAGLQQKHVGFDLPLSEPQIFANALQLLLDQTQGEYSHCSKEAYLYARKFTQNEEALAQNLNLFK